MELNYSQTYSAKAQAKYRLMHPDLKRAANKRYNSSAKGHATMVHCQKCWNEQNREYNRIYQHIYQQMRAAEKSGNQALYSKLFADLRVHQMSLPNRKRPIR